MSKPALYVTQQILRTFMRFIGALMAGVTTGMCVLLASTLFRATPAVALSPLPPPLAAQISVVPLLAAPDVPRKIVVSGKWPNRCGPTAVSLESTDTSQTNILVIRSQFETGAALCGSPAAEYRFELDYTPKSASVLRILLTSNTGVLTGEGNVITTADTKPRSVVDISGIWYDPDTNGSGLNFQQRFRFDDLTFGTWYLYDQAGTARWYSIQNVVWNADGRSFEGKLLETRSATAACPQPGIPCPQTSTALNQVGIVKMTLIGDEFARDDSLRMKVEAVSATNVLLFSSTVRKIVF